MFSQTKDKKHIEQNFHSVAGVMPKGWDLGVLGVKNISMGICDDAHRLHVLVLLYNKCMLCIPCHFGPIKNIDITDGSCEIT